MVKYFITGGDGFIGFFVSKELLKNKDNKIIVYDAHKHYIPLDESDWLKAQDYRIKELKKYSDRVFRIRGDVTDKFLLRKSLEEHNPDSIIHLAALPIDITSNNSPEEARLNVLESIITLMDVARELNLKTKRIIYTSSSMAYGNFLQDGKGNILPAKEEQKCNPIGLYSAMKLCGEYIVKGYSARFNIPYTIIRPSAVYGPTDCNKRVVELFLKNALQGKELILENGGDHKLDFTYVEDLAKGFELAANSDKAINKTFNMTRGEGRSIKELAEIIQKIIPETKIIIKDVETYRPNRGTLDISKAREFLGFNPEYSLEEGIKKYLNFLRDNNFG